MFHETVAEHVAKVILFIFCLPIDTCRRVRASAIKKQRRKLSLSREIFVLFGGPIIPNFFSHRSEHDTRHFIQSKR